MIGIDGKVDLLKLLTTIKNNLNGCINWCDRLNDDEKIKYKILEAKQSVIDMIEQKECYEKLLNDQNNIIVHLQSSNEKLKNEIFTSKLIKYLFSRFIRWIYFECYYVTCIKRFVNFKNNDVNH